MTDARDLPPDPDGQDRLPLTEGGPLWKSLMFNPDGSFKGEVGEAVSRLFAVPDQTRVAMGILPWPKRGVYWITPRVARILGQALLDAAEGAERGEPATEQDAESIRHAVAVALLDEELLGGR